MAHPEDPATAGAEAAVSASKDEDEAVKKQLTASLGTDDIPKLEVCFSAVANRVSLSTFAHISQADAAAAA